MSKLNDTLQTALANSFEMYVRAHSFHWNVEGILFPLYHGFFSDIYEEVHGALDAFAEEIRAAGYFASLRVDHSIAKSKNPVGTQIKVMLQELQAANDEVLKSLTESFHAAEKEDAQGLMDFLASRIDAHKKHAWMLKSCQVA